MKRQRRQLIMILIRFVIPCLGSRVVAAGGSGGLDVVGLAPEARAVVVVSMGDQG